MKVRRHSHLVILSFFPNQLVAILCLPLCFNSAQLWNFLLAAGEEQRSEFAAARSPSVHATSEPALQNRESPENDEPRPPNVLEVRPEPGLAGPGQIVEQVEGGQSVHVEGTLLDTLPPEIAVSPGECDPEIQNRVSKWIELQQHGRLLVDELRASRAYRNPEFFRKMVDYWEIDEYGTAFSETIFDPHNVPPEDMLTALQSEWASEEARRRAARAAGTGRIEFTKASTGASRSQATAAALAAAQAKAAALAARHR